MHAATAQAAAVMSADTAEKTAAAEAAPGECSEDAVEVSQSQDQQGADLPPPSPARRGHILRHHRQHLPALHGARRPHLMRRVRPGAAHRRSGRLPPRGRRRLPRQGRRRPGPRRVRLLPLLQLVPVPPPRRLGLLQLATIASGSLGRGRRRRARARVHGYMHATVPGK